MKQRTIVAALVATAALGGATPALAKPRHRTHTTQHQASTNTTSSAMGNGETALTGSTLSSASAAAIAANPGASVDSATTETDSAITGAAYEVHITKSDGSHAVVIEDASFNVLATQAGCGAGH
jgi:hypothetical protein